jgi:hypothetical protein
VRQVIARHEAGGAAPMRAQRGHNHDGVAAVLAWCRLRFVRFAPDERAATTLAPVMFDQISTDNGIRHLLTAPTPRPTTGTVERLHKTLRASGR